MTSCFNTEIGTDMHGHGLILIISWAFPSALPLYIHKPHCHKWILSLSNRLEYLNYYDATHYITTAGAHPDKHCIIPVGMGLHSPEDRSVTLDKGSSWIFIHVVHNIWCWTCSLHCSLVMMMMSMIKGEYMIFPVLNMTFELLLLAWTSNLICEVLGSTVRRSTEVHSFSFFASVLQRGCGGAVHNTSAFAWFVSALLRLLHAFHL